MAKSPTFGLQKILDFRKSIENKKAIDLKVSQVALEKRQEKLKELVKHKDGIINRNASDKKESKTLDLNQLKITNDYVVQLSKKIEQHNEQVKQSTEIVKHNQDKLMDATKDKKMVEKLKEKFQRDTKKLRNSQETKKESEIASRIAHRNSKNGADRV